VVITGLRYASSKKAERDFEILDQLVEEKRGSGSPLDGTRFYRLALVNNEPVLPVVLNVGLHSACTKEREGVKWP